MARFSSTIILSLIFISCLAHTEQLTVVKGIQVQKDGELSTGIFVSENFPKVGKQVLENETASSSTDMKIVFDKVLAVTVGVVSFHDSDQLLKSNFIEYTSESIGFSRDAKIIIESNKVLTIMIILR